jgi:hypothetical protein
MAKRRGKAASRQARRNAQRSAAQRSAAQGQGPAQGTAAEPTSPPATPSSGGLDAFERADAEVRAASAPPLSSVPRRQKVRAADPRVTVGGSSRLGERAAAEYHYVARDLRNIGVLVLVIAALLAAATVAVNVLGIGRV